MKNERIKNIIRKFLAERIFLEINKEEDKANIELINKYEYLLSKYCPIKKLSDEEVKERVDKIIKRIEAEKNKDN